MSDNPVGSTVVEKTLEQKMAWINAMRQWLADYNNHIDALVREKRIPKPPQW